MIEGCQIGVKTWRRALGAGWHAFEVEEMVEIFLGDGRLNITDGENTLEARRRER